MIEPLNKCKYTRTRTTARKCNQVCWL